MRPRFQSVSPCPLRAAPDRLSAALDRADAPCRGQVYGGHVVLYVLRAEARVWSPFLSADLDWHPEGTLVQGLFGPKPSVWSLFVAAYAVCGFGALFAAVFAYVQWTLGQPPWALWLLGASAAGAAGTYGLARLGQWRGRGQMDLLRGFLDGALASP